MHPEARIFVIDDQNPEDIAMMQALYSRSAASVTDHLAKVKAVGSGKFMESFYVGYGHESIGDCGSTTIFIEGVKSLVREELINPEWALRRTVEELETALRKVETLHGLLPICAHCKKIKDDEGYWTRIETYISDHSRAEFSHGLCPECFERYYGDEGDGGGPKA